MIQGEAGKAGETASDHSLTSEIRQSGNPLMPLDRADLEDGFNQRIE